MGFIPCGFESHLAQIFMLQQQREKIILTADDFGKSERANRRILELARAGKLDRVSVISDGNFAPEEIEELKRTGVKLDIHFELIWQKRRRNLLTDYTLRQMAVFFVNYFWGDWPVPEHPRSGTESVSREWKDQIEKFRKIFGRRPDGINSHEHTHYFPPYFKIALKLAKEFEIPVVRFGKLGILGKVNGVSLILRNLRRWNRKNFLNSKLESSDYFASLDWTGSTAELLKNLSGGKVEIACHPEREDEYRMIMTNF